MGFIGDCCTGTGYVFAKYHCTSVMKLCDVIIILFKQTSCGCVYKTCAFGFAFL